MYVNDDARLIFLAHPRTGSRAVAKLLRDTLRFRAIGSHHSGPDELLKGEWESYRCFTTVRNHWDAWASWWFNAVGQSPEAVSGKITSTWCERWIRGNHNYFFVDRQPEVSKNRMFWFLDLYPPPAILRYEELQRNLSSFLRAYDLPDHHKIPNVGRNKFRRGRPYHEVFSLDGREFIGRTFAEEIAELGYSYLLEGIQEPGGDEV